MAMDLIIFNERTGQWRTTQGVTSTHQVTNPPYGMERVYVAEAAMVDVPALAVGPALNDVSLQGTDPVTYVSTSGGFNTNVDATAVYSLPAGPIVGVDIDPATGVVEIDPAVATTQQINVQATVDSDSVVNGFNLTVQNVSQNYELVATLDWPSGNASSASWESSVFNATGGWCVVHFTARNDTASARMTFFEATVGAQGRADAVGAAITEIGAVNQNRDNNFVFAFQPDGTDQTIKLGINENASKGAYANVVHFPNAQSAPNVIDTYNGSALSWSRTATLTKAKAHVLSCMGSQYGSTPVLTPVPANLYAGIPSSPAFNNSVFCYSSVQEDITGDHTQAYVVEQSRSTYHAIEIEQP